MNKLEIAQELLKNTTNIHLKNLLDEYIINMNLSIAENDFDIYDEWQCIDKCISYFQTVDFNITDWELYEIPIEYTYCFLNTKTRRGFDLVLSNDGQVSPCYVDSNFNQQTALSIQNAIERYYVPDESKGAKKDE